MLTKNSIYTVTIAGYSSEGLGVARVDGQVVFVHRAIRGEVCRIQILKALKNIAYAKIVDWAERSPHRVEPDCPYFGRCGGCDFRHMDYEEELYAKRARVQDALTRIGGADVPVDEIFGAAQTEGYRNKSQYPVSAAGEIGFYRARTHEVVAVERCRLQQETADRAADAVRRWMREYRVSGYDERTEKGTVRHVYTRSNAQGESLVCLIVNASRVPHEPQLVEMVRGACPQAVGILLGVNKKPGNVILGERYRLLWGQETLNDTLGGLTFRLSVPSFYQVNRAQTEVLYQKAVEFAGLTGRETVLDLYCGVGTITLNMAKGAARVIGGEIIPSAIEDAKENARRNDIENADFYCGDAGAIAVRMAAEGLHPEVVTVDPPRKGLAPEVIETIVGMAPERVVYVSCDPGTLGRDLKLFAAQGYTARRAAAVDLFPRTAHCEVVTLLQRIKR